MKQPEPTHNISPIEYAEVSVIAKTTAEEMIERLHWMKLLPKKILNLGSRTGHIAQLLQGVFPDAETIGIDGSPSMLHYALSNAYQKHAICASFEYLPVKPASIDLIVANLLLPWCASLEEVLKECLNALRPNGLFIFSSLGPDTLLEIPQEYLAPLHFKDMHDLGDLQAQIGFEGPVLDRDYVKLRYRDRNKLSRELYINGFTLNELPIETNSLEITHEIIFSHAWRGAVEKSPPGTSTFPLEQLRQQLKHK